MATKRKGKATGGRRESATSPRRLEARDRALKAINLRREGCSFEEIARKLKYSSRQAAHKAVTDLLKETAGEECAELRKLELMRLDKLWEPFFKLALKGNARAAYVCARLSERRSKLAGLDAATEINANVSGNMGGVLVTPGILDPGAWAKAAEQQQEALAAAERQFIKAA